MPYTETVAGDEVFMFWIGSLTGEYTDSIKLNEFTAGKEVPFNIEAKLIKDNEGGKVIVRYQIKRTAGGTSYAEPLEFSVGVALDLTAPGIKEAPNGTSLDPINAQTELTAVVAPGGLRLHDKITVIFTGAAGTPAGGSHTTTPWTVTALGPQHIPLHVPVIAFNLGKTVEITYIVTRDSKPSPPSQALTLVVLPLDNRYLDKPLILQASDGGEGRELDVSLLTAAATVQVNSWPHIALGQPVWSQVKGTKKDGGVYDVIFWEPPRAQTNATWIRQGFWTYSIPLIDLQKLQDGSELTVIFKAGLGGSAVEGEAVSFPLRTYIVKTVEDVKPEIGKITGSTNEAEIPQGGVTVETAVTLSGVAAKGQKVEVFDGNVSKGQATALATTGVWTLPVTALAVAAHSFTAKALYGSNPVSAARTLTVTAVVVPTLSYVLDDKNVEVPEGQTTVSTTLNLKGTASLGQRVEIFDGNGPSAVSKGVATASATGEWERTITLEVGARRLYAKSLYHLSPVYSEIRHLTILSLAAIEIHNFGPRLFEYGRIYDIGEANLTWINVNGTQREGHGGDSLLMFNRHSRGIGEDKTLFDLKDRTFKALTLSYNINGLPENGGPLLRDRVLGHINFMNQRSIVHKFELVAFGSGAERETFIPMPNNSMFNSIEIQLYYPYLERYAYQLYVYWITCQNTL
nr:hypothetical protein [Pseudomonas hamedanensis]